MNQPPEMLDGARVLWWSWSGDTPYGEHFGDTDEDRFVHGFAICQYENGSLYRFSCNKKWEVVNDSVHREIEEAKAAVPLNYDASRVRWQRYSS